MNPQPTVLTDIDIPFFRLVIILLKFMLAAIPAAILFYMVMGIFAMLFAGLFGGSAWLLSQ